jgi:hypothetical protein
LERLRRQWLARRRVCPKARLPERACCFFEGGAAGADHPDLVAARARDPSQFLVEPKSDGHDGLVGFDLALDAGLAREGEEGSRREDDNRLLVHVRAQSRTFQIETGFLAGSGGAGGSARAR